MCNLYIIKSEYVLCNVKTMNISGHVAAVYATIV